jgi:tetratricopeptide (TPR) repeat protein
MSVRTNLIQWTLVVLPFLAAAQPKQLIISARSGDPAQPARPAHNANTPVSHSTERATTDQVDIADDEALNTIPLFGERPKTTERINAEIHFLNECDQNFSNRSEASNFFTARGWEYIDNRQLDTAIHRFNLAWLLNNDNADAYWGLGVVCYQKNLLPDAIRMLKKGVSVADSNIVMMTDLATLEIKSYQEKPDANMLTDAERHLNRAVTLNPNALSLQKLSVVQYLKADYAKAWEYFHQANSLDSSALDVAYLSDLLAKQPDPKGVFK